MKLYKGMKVRVRSLGFFKSVSFDEDSKGIPRVKWPGLNGKMIKLCGKAVTIKQVGTSLEINIIKIEEDNWTWAEWMFEDDCNELVFKVLKGE